MARPKAGAEPEIAVPRFGDEIERALIGQKPALRTAFDRFLKRAYSGWPMPDDPRQGAGGLKYGLAEWTSLRAQLVRLGLLETAPADGGGVRLTVGPAVPAQQAHFAAWRPPFRPGFEPADDGDDDD